MNESVENFVKIQYDEWDFIKRGQGPDIFWSFLP